MPELPAGTDRSRLVVVLPTEVPEGTEPVEHVVGAAWLTSSPGDFEFLRFDGETEEQAAEREKAAAESAKSLRPAAPQAPSDRFAQQ